MSELKASEVHIPVLLSECLQYLSPHSNGLYIDGTLGLGGHTEAILQQSSPHGKVIAFDWDASALARVTERLLPFGDRVQFIRRNFAEISGVLGDLKIGPVDGLLLDVGLSSLQLDVHEGRGFSFQRDEPLDMRMDNRRDTTAATILANASEEELADILYYYGEEKQARRIAGAIVSARGVQAIETTKELVAVIVDAVPRRFHPKKIHIATRTFQALRIAVNGELENLGKILDEGSDFLCVGAKFCVISFHSLEDRLVKRKFRNNRHLKEITSSPIVAGEEERSRNPRARSARLRVAVRV